MVIIVLPSPFVSVAVALINVLMELLLLKTFKNLNNMYECARLKRHRLIRIRSHVHRIRFVTVFALIFFLVLEVNYSTFSSPFETKTERIEACVSVRPSVQTRFETHQFSLEARATVTSCLTVEGDEVSIRIGNFSLESEKMHVSCSEKVYFKFRIKDERELSTADTTLSCVPAVIEDFCVRAKHGDNNTDNVLWLTDAYNIYAIMEEKLPFRRSEVYFPFHEHMKLFATRMAQNAVYESSYSIFFRNSVLLDAVNDTCVFEEEGARATSIPTPIAIVLVTSWVISLVAFILTTVQQGGRFYNVGNAFDVACKTKRASDDESYPIEHASIRMVVDSDSLTRFVMCNGADQQQISKKDGVGVGNSATSPNGVLGKEMVAHLEHAHVPNAQPLLEHET